jgi:hypothetical protein
MATNDVVVQNMLLLTDNILPHKICLKLGGMILNEGTQIIIFCFNTGGTDLGRFLYLCWIEQRHFFGVSMWQIHMVVMTCKLLLTWQKYTFVGVYFDMSSKSIMEYFN